MIKIFALVVVALYLTQCDAQVVSSYPIPQVLMPIKANIVFSVANFDPSRISAKLNLSNNLTTVDSLSARSGIWQTVSGITGYSKGKHYCHFQLVIGAQNTLFGVFDWSYAFTYVSNYAPAVNGNDGCAYYGGSGNVYYSNGANSALGPSANQYDVIGIYFDADVSAVSFFKNGVLLGNRNTILIYKI